MSEQRFCCNGWRSSTASVRVCNWFFPCVCFTRYSICYGGPDYPVVCIVTGEHSNQNRIWYLSIIGECLVFMSIVGSEGILCITFASPPL